MNSGVTAFLLNNTSGTTTTGTYTAYAGVITFGGGETNINTELADVMKTMLAAQSGVGYVAAFYNAGTGSTYVVQDAGGVFSLITLTGLSGVTDLGSTAAANAIVVSGITAWDAGGSWTTNTASLVQNDANDNYQAITGSGGGFSGTFSNLAASAIIADSATGTYRLTTSQVAAGTSSLTLNLTGSDVGTITALSVSGDNALAIASGETNGTTITSLVDGGATNSLAAINITGTTALTLAGITDTALVNGTINDASTGAFTLGVFTTPYGNTPVPGTAISQAGLTVNIGGGGTGAGTTFINVSGAGDIINDGTYLTSTGGAAGASTSLQWIVASGR